MTDYLVVQRLGEIEFALSRLRDTIRECSQPQGELFALAEKVFLAALPVYDTAAQAESRARKAFEIARVFLAQRDKEQGAA